MTKRVFFSFHYRDVIDFRANVVRNHWMTKPDRDEAGYFDASVWESARRQGDAALKRLINGALENTSNTLSTLPKFVLQISDKSVEDKVGKSVKK